MTMHRAAQTASPPIVETTGIDARIGGIAFAVGPARMTSPTPSHSVARASTLAVSALFIGASTLFGCGAATAPEAIPDDSPSSREACFHETQDPQLPHVDAAAGAERVLEAIQDVVALQPPCTGPNCADATASSYAVSSLECMRQTPLEAAACALSISLPTGGTAAVFTPAANASANLVAALEAAGAKVCNDTGVRVQNLTVRASHVVFDDASLYSLPIPPNVSAQEVDARSIRTALGAAGLDDCDVTRDLAIHCARDARGATCTTEWTLLHRVGDSELAASCNADASASPGPALSGNDSEAIWRAVKKAAADAGYTPPTGSLEDATFLSASGFAIDATGITFWQMMTPRSGGGHTRL